MLPNHLRARLDRARASSDPDAGLEAVARSLKSEGMGQYPLYRLLGEYLSGLRDPWDDAVEGAIDLAWGAPWARGRPLFDRPLVEEASLAAREVPYSVNEVVANLRRLDGQAARVTGRLWLGFEISSLWHASEAEQKPGGGSSLALRDDLRRWLRLREDEGRPVAGAPAHWNAREVTLWLHEEFCNQLVQVTAVVDARHRGHMGCRPGGIFLLSIARSGAGID